MSTRALLSIALMIACCGVSVAQEFPTKPIRIVIPAPPGGGSDALARPIAAEMSERLKQPVVIDNRPGAAGNIAAQVVARAEPDGYTLILANVSITTNPFLYKNPGYDLVADFAPVLVIATSPMLVVVHKNSPVKTLAEFVALAKKNPGKLNFGTGGVGTPNHLAPLLFNKLAGIDVVHIPYNGAGPNTKGLLQQEIDIYFATAAAAEPYVKSGEFRALAVTSKERFSAFPTVPSVAESGIPGVENFNMQIWWGLLAPARTDPQVLDKLHAAAAAGVRDPKNRERWLGQGILPTVSSRTEFQSLIKGELQKWESVVRENAIAVE